MKIRDENVLVTIARTILSTIVIYLLIMYPGILFTLIVGDGLSLSQIWDRYSLVEMIIPVVAACWLGTPVGFFFAFLILIFDVDI